MTFLGSCPASAEFEVEWQATAAALAGDDVELFTVDCPAEVRGPRCPALVPS